MLKPYRFSFLSKSLNGGSERIFWIRFYNDMELAFSDTKKVVLKENPDAKSFMIESNQREDAHIPDYWIE